MIKLLRVSGWAKTLIPSSHNKHSRLNCRFSNSVWHIVKLKFATFFTNNCANLKLGFIVTERQVLQVAIYRRIAVWLSS